MDTELSARRREELKEVGLVLLGIGVTTAFVAVALDRAWAAGGLLRGTVDVVFPTDGVAVVFSTGVLVGWILLFVLDRSKRVQAPAMVLLSGVLVLALLAVGRLRIVDWVGNAPFLAVGLLVGLVTGGASALTTNRREFPVAALGLYTVALVLAVVGVVDAYLVGGWFVESSPSATGYALALLCLPAAVGFVALVGYFVRYRDQREVAVVSSSEGNSARAATAVLTGLTKHLQQEYDSNLFAGAGTVANAPADIERWQPEELEDRRLRPWSRSDIGSRGLPRGLDEPLGIEYRSPQLVSRWIKITAFPTGEADPDELATAVSKRQESSVPARVIDVLFGPYVELLERRGGATESVETADVVVFVVSARDFLPEDAEGPVEPRNLVTPEYVETMAEVSAGLDRDIRRVLAIYDGEIAAALVSHDRGRDQAIDDTAVLDTLRDYPLRSLDCDVAIALAASEEDRAIDGAPILREELTYE